MFFVLCSDYYSLQIYEEDCYFIADGEIVAAYQDGYWFRAKIMKCSKERVLVSSVIFVMFLNGSHKGATSTPVWYAIVESFTQCVCIRLCCQGRKEGLWELR